MMPVPKAAVILSEALRYTLAQYHLSRFRILQFHNTTGGKLVIHGIVDLEGNNVVPAGQLSQFVPVSGGLEIRNDNTDPPSF